MKCKKIKMISGQTEEPTKEKCREQVKAHTNISSQKWLDDLKGKTKIDASSIASLDEIGENTMWLNFLNIGGLPFHNSSPRNN